MEQLLQTLKQLREIVSDLENKHDRKFTLDGHLFGSIGEVYASKKYNLTLLPQSSKAHDAKDEQNNYVQIKVTQKRTVGLRGVPDKLLVLKFNSNTNDFDEIYYGDGHEAVEIALSENSANQKVVTLTKLRQLTEKRQSKTIS